MPNQGNSFVNNFSPYLQNTTDIITNAIITRAKEKRDREALQNLFKKVEETQGNMGNISTGFDPNDIKEVLGETVPQTINTPRPISPLPVQNSQSNNLLMPGTGRGNSRGTQNSGYAPFNGSPEPQNNLPYKSTYDSTNLTPETLKALMALSMTDSTQGKGGTGYNPITPQKPTGQQANVDVSKLGGTTTYEEQAPSDFMLGDVLPQEERYKRANQQVSDFIVNALEDPNIDMNRLKLIANEFGQQAATMKPKEFEPFNLPEGTKRAVGLKKEVKEDEDPYEWVENPKDVPPKDVKDEKVDSYTGMDGYSHTIYKKADGTQYEVKGDEKVKTPASGDSAAWARLYYDMQKDRTKKVKENRQKQSEYNVIMGSPFVDMKDLVAQGFDLSPEEAKYGGAYVVTEIIKGQPNVRLNLSYQQM